MAALTKDHVVPEVILLMVTRPQCKSSKRELGLAKQRKRSTKQQRNYNKAYCGEANERKEREWAQGDSQADVGEECQTRMVTMYQKHARTRWEIDERWRIIWPEVWIIKFPIVSAHDVLLNQTISNGKYTRTLKQPNISAKPAGVVGRDSMQRASCHQIKLAASNRPMRTALVPREHPSYSALL